MELMNEIEMSDMKQLWDAIEKADEQIGCITFPDAFFPELGTPGTAFEYRWAMSMCNECPVKLLCAEYAIKHDEPHGIWGGLSPKQRQQIRSLRRA